MWIHNAMCVFILAAATVIAERYYESEITSWNDVTCNLEEPQLRYNNGYFEVNDKLLNIDDVWIGYVYAKVPFLLLGCASLQSENVVNVTEIGDCFTICTGGKFGIKRTSLGSGLLCICVIESFDTSETSCKGGDQNSICNNCFEIYTQINVNASNVDDPGIKPEGDCLTYYYPQFKWQLCSRTDYIRSICSNSTYTDSTSSATVDDINTREWSAANKLCMRNGRHPSFERSITNAGFGSANSQYFWTGMFRANILIKLSLKDYFSRFSTESYVYVKRSSMLLTIANTDVRKRALCVTGTEITSRLPETSKYIPSTISETGVFITKVTTSDVTTTAGSTSRMSTSQMHTTFETDDAFPTKNDEIIEDIRHTNSEKSPALGLGIGVSVGILFLVGGAVVIVVLKRRGLLPCWKIKSAEGQSSRSFEESQDTNYEGMIERNESNESYCALGRNVVSGEGIVSYINSQINQNNLKSTEDKYSPEYYNTGTYEYVQKAHTESDLKNK